MRKAFSLKSRGLFDPGASKPFKVSRTGIELFLECSRCFYLNHRFGIRRPSGPPFNLNSLVDRLLKKEFDVHRVNATTHPIMSQYGVDAVPFQHAKIDEWRENFKGVQTLHAATNLKVTGAVDDLWINPAGEVIVVDYKSTAKNSEVTIDADWQMAYKRQMEVYQWLVRQQGITVSNTGYFVYCNGQDAEAFNGRIQFSLKVLPYTGDDCWIEGTLVDLKTCLMGEEIPDPPNDCEFCGYASARMEQEITRVDIR